MAERIAAKSLSPVDLVQRYLDRITEVDPSVQAWRELDGERALRIALIHPGGEFLQKTVAAVAA